MEEKELLLFQDTELDLIERAVECLQTSRVKSARYEVNEEKFDIYVDEEEFEDAKDILIQLLEKDAARLTERVHNEEAERKLKIYEEMQEEKGAGLKTTKQKLEEVKSSAFAFLIVGIAGILFLAMEFLDVFSLNLEGFIYIAFYAVMVPMFVIFIVVGIVNFLAIPKWRMKAAEEEIMMNNIREYVHHDLMEAFSKDFKLMDSEEDNYFEIERQVRMKLLMEFSDLPVYLLEEATEEAIKLL